MSSKYRFFFNFYLRCKKSKFNSYLPKLFWCSNRTWFKIEKKKINDFIGVGTTLIGFGVGYILYRISFIEVNASYGDDVGVYNPSLPNYRSDEINKHSTLQERVWVTFRAGVYDITDFLPKHPGGDEKILMAAGGALEPFWKLYGVHFKSEILKLLERYRIGNFISDDSEINSDSDDPYAQEPKRHSVFQVSSLKPFNAETPSELLVASFITPNDFFYIRNHLPVPNIDISNYLLEVTGEGVRKPKSFTLDDIKNFPRYSVTTTLQCAGNRRNAMNKVKPVRGLDWKQGAIGNAKWTGARLIDLLDAVNFDYSNKNVRHAQFEGLDCDFAYACYGASIPYEIACDPNSEVILAYEMNDEILPRDHGYPIRVIVPGIVGARNVKWLGRIVMSNEESNSHWQQKDYKAFNPNVDWDSVDWNQAPAIQDTPVMSAICSPLDETKVKLKNGKFTVRGYATTGGGRRIIRVDISTDQGKTWQVANLEPQPDCRYKHCWSWTIWEATVSVPEHSKNIEIWAKAVDSSYNTQPEETKNIWNLRGVLSNAYHRITVNVQK